MTTDSPAILAALAAIEKNGRAVGAMNAKLAADRRLNALNACVKALDVPFPDGFGGGLAVFTSIHSSRGKRRLRAQYLAAGRTAQLRGEYHAALNWIEKAAACRYWERLYLSLETMNLEHVEGRIGGTPVVPVPSPYAVAAE